MARIFLFNDQKVFDDKKILSELRRVAIKYHEYVNMGYKDLETEKNIFEVGLGNCIGIIGFDRRKPEPALPVPTTVMKRSIYDYVSKPVNVVAILLKNKNERYYNKVIGSVSNGIKAEDLPSNILKKIDRNLHPIIISKSKYFLK